MKLSIVITAYNIETYIADCIKSILNQKIKNHELEIIVVEDKSTDATLNVIYKFSKNIKIIAHEVNQGAGLSRRDGIQNSTGDYIMLVDGDDYFINENHLQTLMDKAEETNADIVSGGIKVLQKDGVSDITSYGNYTCLGIEKVTKFWGNRIVYINNKIIRRELHDKIVYSHRRYIEDTQVIIPMLWLANKVEYVDSVGYVYRLREGSLTHNADELKNTIFKALCWCDLMEFFNANDPSVIEVTNIKGYISNCINYFNNRIITSEEIKPYINEFTELMFKLINIVAITNINFKQPFNQNINYGK